MNKVILMGRLTREPDIKTSQSGTMIARYTLAVDRRFSREGEQTADFISCIAFGKGAEFVGKYLHQGTKIVVTGHIQTGNYVKQDGTKVYTTDVIVEDHEFAESKGTSQGQDEPQPAPDIPASDDFMDIPDGLDQEQLPFR